MLVKDYDAESNKIRESSKFWNVLIGLVFLFLFICMKRKLFWCSQLHGCIFFIQGKSCHYTDITYFNCAFTLYFGLLNVIANLGEFMSQFRLIGRIMVYYFWNINFSWLSLCIIKFSLFGIRILSVFFTALFSYPKNGF